MTVVAQHFLIIKLQLQLQVLQPEFVLQKRWQTTIDEY